LNKSSRVAVTGFLLLLSAQAFMAAGARAGQIMLQVEDMEGPWQRQTNISGYTGPGFCTSNAAGISDSVMTGRAEITRPGTYVVWARGYASANSPRAFRVKVADTLFEATHSGKEGRWTWQRCGEIELPAGIAAVTVIDAAAGFESADAIFLTDDKELDPMEDEQIWKPFESAIPDSANALRYTIDSCCELARRRKLPATREEWEGRRETIRRELASAMGLDPMPERTPLNAVVTGRTEREGYSIENVIFESRPKFHVTSTLYIPKNAQFPAPAVVVVPGHAMEDGKNYGLYNIAQLGLVRQGIIVLAYDPIGQGERRLPGFKHELGYAALLTGLTNEGIIVWDTMRAIDYLVSRQEVDPKRIGLTGNSGGGENTFYTTPLEPRIAAAASFCFVCSYEYFLSDGGNHCICNHLPGIVRRMEEFEIIGANAPRPFLFGNALEDKTFPIPGVRYTRDCAKAVYAFAGAGANLVSVEVPGGHGWSAPLREAAAGWFAKHLLGRGDGSPIPEGEIKPEDAKSRELLCYKDGAKMPDDAETVVTLSRKKAKQLAESYATPPATEEEWLRGRGELEARLWDVFGGRPKAFAPTARTLRKFDHNGASVEMLLIRTEERMEVAAALVRPAGDIQGATVIISDGALRNGVESPLTQSLISHGMAVLVVNPRGIGETAQPLNQLTSDSVCLGRHIFAQQVWDAGQAVRWMKSRHEAGATTVTLHGDGPCGLTSVFAAALGAGADRVSCSGTPASFICAIENEMGLPIWACPTNVLKVADVPQALALIESDGTLVLNPSGQRGLPLDGDSMDEAFRYPIAIREFGTKEKALNIRRAEEGNIVEILAGFHAGQ